MIAPQRAIPRPLTLNYGIRWEIYKPQTVNAPGKGGDVSLDTGEVQAYGVGNSWKPGGGTSNMSGNVQTDYKLLAPRVGLAYQLDSKTVIRAGFGRGFSMGAFGTVFGHNITQNLPVLASQTLVAPRNFDAAFNLASGPGATPNPRTVLNGRPLGPNWPQDAPSAGSDGRECTSRVRCLHQLTTAPFPPAGWSGVRHRRFLLALPCGVL